MFSGGTADQAAHDGAGYHDGGVPGLGGASQLLQAGYCESVPRQTTHGLCRRRDPQIRTGFVRRKPNSIPEFECFSKFQLSWNKSPFGKSWPEMCIHFDA